MHRPFLLDAPLQLVLPWLQHRPEDTAYLLAAADAVRQRLTPLPTTAPACGLCHGDLHKRNVLDDGQGRLTVLDWDCLGYGWRAYDLAVLRWSIGPPVGPQGIGEPRLTAVWVAYLRAYQERRTLKGRL